MYDRQIQRVMVVLSMGREGEMKDCKDGVHGKGEEKNAT